MRDFNFFAPYLKKNKKQFDAGTFLKTALAIVLAAILVLTAFLFVRLNQQKQRLNQLQTEIENPDYQAQYQEAQKAFTEVEELGLEKEFFVRLQGAMMEVHRVNEHFMQFLGKEVIKDLYLNDISIQNREITLNGTALSKHAIAQFERDLRKTDTFEDVKITEIHKKGDSENYYMFNMIIKSKFGEHSGNGTQVNQSVTDTNSVSKNAGGENGEVKNKQEDKKENK